MISSNARQPIFNVPPVIVILVVAIGIAHVGRLLMSDVGSAHLLARFAFVPGRLTFLFDGAAVLKRLATAATLDPSSDGPAAVGEFFLGSGSAQPWTVLSYAFLHGNWTHVGLNAIWLLAFGTPVARRFGPALFMLFAAMSAIAGAVAHYAVDPFSLQPLIGASAAVSGCMGAALRFMFQPPQPSLTSRFDSSSAPSHAAPRRSIGMILFERRALTFIVVWFVSNLVTGLAAVPLGISEAPIAWQAHIGGFAFGLLAFRLFDPISDAVPPQPPSPPNSAEPDGVQ